MQFHSFFSRSVLGCPVSRLLVEAVSVIAVQPRSFRIQRTIGVCIREKRGNRQQHLGDREAWAPVVLEDVKADTTVGIDVRVVHLRRESYLWWLERIVCREVDVEVKRAATVGRVCWPNQDSLPLEHVRLLHWAGTNSWRWLLLHVLKLTLNTTQRHRENFGVASLLFL